MFGDISKRFPISTFINTGEIGSITFNAPPESRPDAALPRERTLFISHSSKDKDQIDPFINLLIAAGFPRRRILYTSNPALGVPLGEEIHDYLRKNLTEDTFVIFMLSKNFHKSSVCENEMGAVWSKKLRHCNLYLKGFHYHDIKDVASPTEMALRYEDETSVLRDKLGQLRRRLEKHFDFEFVDSEWEESRERFLSSIK